MNKASPTSLASVIDLLLDAVCVVDASGRIVFASAACERIFGYTPEEMRGKAMIEMVVADDVARTLAAANEVMAGQPKLHFENRYKRKDGREVHIMWSACWSESDQLRIGVARDISELKQAQALQTAIYSISEAAHAAKDLVALFQQIHQIIDTLLPALGFCVALYDAPSDQLNFPYHVEEQDQASSSLEPSTSICQAVVRSGQPLLLTPETLNSVLATLSMTVDVSTFCWLGVPLYSSQGTIGALVLKSRAGSVSYTEKHLELLQFVATQVVTAIERKRLYARLQHMAQNDELTGLPNRTFLYDRLQVALARVKHSGGRLGVIFLDLNKFKQVNDSFGHAVGDLLLQEVASRLKQVVREGDTVARIGGDEFVVLLETIKQPETAVLVSGKIRAALSQPMDLEGRNVHILPSIGIAHYPEHGDGIAQLLKYADEAMYVDKNSGNP
ncbi:MAG: diguanylate cyclase [Pseudomonas sp.]|uniref:sensor domain-containing protein n=1 Tax=Pseudomonas sp. TaxID=306 RepID=UPI002733A603|nr:GGDEF domain-containing protein [Pseudomonas sp.]MDP3846637.1 diguanylate cyclase [Pseudomonas sp.]